MDWQRFIELFALLLGAGGIGAILKIQYDNLKTSAEAISVIGQSYEARLKALSDRVTKLEADIDARDKVIEIQEKQITELTRLREARDARIAVMEEQICDLQAQLAGFKMSGTFQEGDG